MKKLLISIVFLVIAFIEIKAQAPQYDFYTLTYKDNGDTVRIYNQNGNWWFGPIIGVNRSLYFNDLNQLEFPFDVTNPFNTWLKYDDGAGWGFYGGLFAEYLPAEKYWGFGIKANILDNRNVTAQTQLPRDTARNYYFEYFTTYQYISISPYARYSLPFQDTELWGVNLCGIHLLGGFDLEFSLYDDAHQIHKQRNSEIVINQMKISHTDMKTRFNFHLGVGWDLILADIQNAVRVNVTPYITAHVGTKTLGDYNSDWNEVLIRAGLQLKFGPNVITIDTLKYNSLYQIPPAAFATIQDDRGVQFQIPVDIEPFPRMQLTMIEIPPRDTMPSSAIVTSTDTVQIYAAIRGELPYLSKMEIVDTVQSIIDSKYDIKFGKQPNFSFPSSKTTTLTKEMKEYFDELAVFAKQNPGAEIRIVGHTDNTGSTRDKQEVSKARALEAEKYLKKAGIKNTIRTNGQSDFAPVAPNNTEAGKRKNRRIEIVIVQ